MSRATRTQYFTRFDVLTLIAVVALVALMLPNSLSRVRAHARNTACAANLSSIGIAFAIYANDNNEWLPHHYSEPLYQPGPIPGSFTHSVRWVGTMGSRNALRISDATSPDVSPQASHPSRSLFLLITFDTNSPADFVCPDSGDEQDDLLNYGNDAGGPGTVEPGIPGVSRFDFRGYNNLSYGYQLPYGRRARPSLRLDPQFPVVADKGPYYRAARGHSMGTRTVSDRRSRIDPPLEFLDLTLKEILQLPAEDWAAFNSRNHGGAGQNILRLDGSVEFADTPIVGVRNDNLYTISGSMTDARGPLVGLVQDEGETLGPLMNTDSFIVP